MLFILRMLLVLVLAQAVLRFARGLARGLGGGSSQRRREERRPPLAFDESDIIDARYTEIRDGDERTGR